MHCGNCGYKNEESYKFCGGCGSPLNSADQTAVIDGSTDDETVPEPAVAGPIFAVAPAAATPFAQPVYGTLPPQPPLTMKRKKSKLPVIIALALVAVIGVVAAGGIFGASALNTREYEKLMDTGNKYLSELNYEEAVEVFLKAIDIKPKREDAYIGAATGYIGLGEPEKAEAILAEGVERVKRPNRLLLDMDSLLETATQPLPTDAPTTAQPEPEKQQVLAPEAAVTIFLNNKSLWMQYPEYEPTQGYYYGFLDLDFDGVLELISTQNDGSGRYSTTWFYKINLSDYSVQEIAVTAANTTENEGMGFAYDYAYLQDYPQLLRNKSTEQYIYWCADYGRGSYDEYGTLEGTLYLKNGLLRQDPMFSQYSYRTGTIENPSVTEGFAIYKNGDFEEFSGDRFRNERDAFLAANINQNLSWKYVYGKDLEIADESEQNSMLLDAYYGFSYDGFSFGMFELFSP